MKKSLIYVGCTSLLLMMAACNDEKNLYQGGGTEEEDTKVVNTFDFSTVTSAEIQVSYKNIGYGDYTTSVYFEVYAENPITEGEYGVITRNEGVNPVYSGYTSEDGTWSGEVELPAYAETVYVYSPAFFAQTLMSAEVSASSTIVLSDASYKTAKATRKTVVNSDTEPFETNAVTVDGWKTWLGAYNHYKKQSGATDYKQYCGGISYADVFYSDEDKNTLSISSAKATELLSKHQAIINTGTNSVCPESYRTSKDLTISKDAAVAITLLGGNTGWSNSMAYYYYDEDDAVPTSRSGITPILIVPNTQDGEYNNENFTDVVQDGQGIKRGTTVQLYYYGPAGSMSESQKTNIFPEGTKIGFILKSHAWPYGNCWDCGKNHTATNSYYSTTTPGLNATGAYESGSGVAMYTPDGENLLISFEDHSNDQNFSDVVFTMSTNPVGAFTDVNTAQQSTVTTTIEKGVYAYEDLWPSKGDYDMNDVIVEASAEKVSKKDVTTITTTGSGAATTTTVISTDWYLASETFIFTPYANYAQKTNGLAFTYVPSSGISSSNITGWALTVDGEEVTGATYDETDKVFYLTENVKNYLGKEFRLTVNYVAPVWNEASETYTTTNVVSASEQSGIKPFIYQSEGANANWEVHIPYEAPTSKMNTSYFKSGDDLSDPSTGAYYVRSGNYPFAFYLAGATIDNVSKLLIDENEQVAIDELYPKFLDWAQSSGANSKDWYK